MEKITTTKFIELLRDKTPVTKPMAIEIVEGFFKLIVDSVLEGKEVVIKDFGKFKLKVKGARMSRNPRTGEPVQVPEKTTFKFYPVKKLRNVQDIKKK